MENLNLISSALVLAARAHQNQRRKDDVTPYINHPISVFNHLIKAGITDPNILAASLLHDVLEDCRDITAQEIEDATNSTVLALVREVSDDKSLSKKERKRNQLEHAKDKSPGAAVIKLADKLDNLNSFISNPPHWSVETMRGYTCWAYHVTIKLPSENEYLRSQLVTTFQEINKRIGVTYSTSELQTYLDSC